VNIIHSLFLPDGPAMTAWSWMIGTLLVPFLLGRWMARHYPGREGSLIASLVCLHAILSVCTSVLEWKFMHLGLLVDLAWFVIFEPISILVMASGAASACFKSPRGVALLFLVFTSGVLRAQPAVTLAPLDKSIPSGVTIVPFSDPSFDSLVSDSIPTAIRSEFAGILPYSILVRNNSTQPILAVTVYFDVVNANGHPMSTVQSRQSVPPLKVGCCAILPLAGSLLFTPEPVYTEAVSRLHDHAPMRENFADLMRGRPALYESAKSVTFVLDSVLFADGKFVGPDAKHKFDEYSSQLSAQSFLAKTVLAYRGRSVDDLQNYLEMLSTVPAGAQVSRYERWLCNLAGLYGATLRRKGPEVLFGDVEIDAQRVASVPIHR
jgi:hypothetical protein